MMREYNLKRFFIISMFVTLTAGTAFAQGTALTFSLF